MFKDNCLAGCPCDGFLCLETTTAPEITTQTAPTTTTSPSANGVLMLSTKQSSNKPMIIDFNGWFGTFNHNSLKYLHYR